MALDATLSGLVRRIRIKRTAIIALVCALFVGLSPVLAACQSPGVAPQRAINISIGGATGMLPVLEELTAEFNRRTPTAYFELRGGGSKYGEEQALAGRVNLGASTLPPEEEPVANGVAARNPRPIEAGLTRIPIGIDGLALIVHRTNPIEMISLEQAALIFEGRVLDWAAVGGNDGEILLVSREDGSGARHIFETRVMGDSQVALTAVVMPTSRDVVEYVAKTPGAIGYVSRAYVHSQLPQSDGVTGESPADGGEGDTPAANSFDGLPAVKVLGLEGHWPVDAAIQNQLYPLSYPIYLVSRREPTGTVRQFVDFILSPAGQAIVGRYHVRVR